MGSQTCWLGKRSSTVLTFVWLFSRVKTLMASQCGGLTECSIAILTLVRPFPGVDSSMSSQTSLGVEKPLTFFTLPTCSILTSWEHPVKQVRGFLLAAAGAGAVQCWSCWSCLVLSWWRRCWWWLWWGCATICSRVPLRNILKRWISFFHHAFKIFNRFIRLLVYQCSTMQHVLWECLLMGVAIVWACVGCSDLHWYLRTTAFNHLSQGTNMSFGKLCYIPSIICSSTHGFKGEAYATVLCASAACITNIMTCYRSATIRKLILIDWLCFGERCWPRGFNKPLTWMWYE